MRRLGGSPLDSRGTAMSGSGIPGRRPAIAGCLKEAVFGSRPDELGIPGSELVPDTVDIDGFATATHAKSRYWSSADQHRGQASGCRHLLAEFQADLHGRKDLGSESSSAVSGLKKIGSSANEPCLGSRPGNGPGLKPR